MILIWFMGHDLVGGVWVWFVADSGDDLGFGCIWLGWCMVFAYGSFRWSGFVFSLLMGIFIDQGLSLELLGWDFVWLGDLKLGKPEE